tara:strand:- start:10217 stop:10426 length:210 start_codon:yes stop_codon:yes gene_type:complete
MFFMYVCDAGGPVRPGDPLQLVGAYLRRCSLATPCCTTLGNVYVFAASPADFAVHPVYLTDVLVVALEG